MFFKINSFWTFVGATLMLVAIYLVLTNSKSARLLFATGTKNYAGLLGVLQGRTYGVSTR